MYVCTYVIHPYENAEGVMSFPLTELWKGSLNFDCLAGGGEYFSRTSLKATVCEGKEGRGGRSSHWLKCQGSYLCTCTLHKNWSHMYVRMYITTLAYLPRSCLRCGTPYWLRSPGGGSERTHSRKRHRSDMHSWCVHIVQGHDHSVQWTAQTYIHTYIQTYLVYKHRLQEQECIMSLHTAHACINMHHVCSCTLCSLCVYAFSALADYVDDNDPNPNDSRLCLLLHQLSQLGGVWATAFVTSEGSNGGLGGTDVAL